MLSRAMACWPKRIPPFETCFVPAGLQGDIAHATKLRRDSEYTSRFLYSVVTFRRHRRPASPKHCVVVNADQGQNLVIASSDSLLVYLVAFGIPAIEPRVGADPSSKPIFGGPTEQHAHGEAVGGKILTRKPPIRHLGGTREPFTALRPVADEEAKKIPALDQPDGRGGPARVEDLGDCLDGLKIGLQVGPRDRTKQIVGHEQAAGEPVAGAVGFQGTGRRPADSGGLAEEDTPSAVVPVPELVSDRKPLTAAVAAAI